MDTVPTADSSLVDRQSHRRQAPGMAPGDGFWCGPEGGSAEVPWWSSRQRRLLSLLWLGILTGGDIHLFSHHVSAGHRATVIVLNAVVVGVFFVGIMAPPRAWRVARGALLPVSIGLIWATVLALAVVDGSGWLYGFAFTVVPVVRSGRRSSLVALPVSAVITLIAGLSLSEGSGNLIGTVVSVLGTTAIVFGFSRLVTANAALRAAQEERAAVAVSEERNRFARDLHDLLGHSLSVIALKSELAGRLLGDSPERAAAEVNEIERVARGALREVREAVSGYRRPTLAVELAGARSALAAADVSWNLDVGEMALPDDIEAVLAWTVREGVTNVMRHSHAEHCTVRVMADGEEASVVISDDGIGAPGSGVMGQGGAGNGLRGLAERVRAAGGSLEAGPRPAGGFRLRVSVPLGDGG